MRVFIDWLNRLCKYRIILTGRILGTVPVSDPKAQGLRDLFDKMLILRAETTALTALLIEKGIITADRFREQIQDEAKHLCETYQKTFPGTEPTDNGITFNDIQKVMEWMSKFPP